MTSPGRFGWKPGGTEEGARHALCRLGRHLYRRGLVAGTAGNVSLRLDVEHLLLTPRGLHKGFLEPSDLVRVSLSHPSTQELVRATSEMPLHRACHQTLPEPLVVLHTHAPALTALGMLGEGDDEGEAGPRAPKLPRELHQAVGPLAWVSFHPSGSDGLADAVASAVAAGATVLLLQLHGAITVGATMEEALDRTELAELGAQAALLARQRG